MKQTEDLWQQHSCVCIDVSPWHGIILCLNRRKRRSSFSLIKTKTLNHLYWCHPLLPLRNVWCLQCNAEAEIISLMNGWSWENKRSNCVIPQTKAFGAKAGWDAGPECCWKYLSSDVEQWLILELLCLVTWRNLNNYQIYWRRTKIILLPKSWMKSEVFTCVL